MSARTASNLKVRTAKAAQKRPTFKAAITKEQVDSIEKIAQAGGIARRIALLTLAQDAEEMLCMEEDEAEAFLTSAGEMQERLKQLTSEREYIEAAQARIFLVLGYLYPAPTP